MNTLRVLCLSFPLVLGGCLTEYSSTEYHDGYAGPGPAYYGPSGGVYRSYDTYQPGYYSPAYRRPYYPGSYGYNDYRHNNSDRDCDDNDHRSGSSKKKSSSSERDIRLVDYDQNRRRSDLPDGYHSPDWWKDRGYSMSQNSYKTRDGEVKGKAAQEKHKSSSHKSSSGKDKHKSD